MGGEDIAMIIKAGTRIRRADGSLIVTAARDVDVGFGMPIRAGDWIKPDGSFPKETDTFEEGFEKAIQRIRNSS